MENLIFLSISSIIMITLYVYFLLTVCKLLKPEKITKNKIIIVIATVSLCHFGATALKSVIPLSNTILFIIVLTALLHFLLHNTILKSFLVSISFIIFIAITETLSIVLSTVLFNADYQSFSSNNYKVIIALIIQLLLSMGIIKLISLIFCKQFNLKLMFSNITKKQIIILAIAIMICTFPQIVLLILNEYSYPISFLIMNTIQFIVVCVFLFFYLKAKIEFEKTQSDLFTSELHNKTLIGMVDGVRTLKHDYNNIIQSLNGYVSTKQYDKLQDHINYVLSECNIVNNLSVIDPKIFNEPAIYGIVGSKFFLALEDDIKFDLDIATDISKIQFSMPDLSRILGILLDNAMEATKKCDTPYIRLEMKYDKRKCADVINVINNYDTSITINLEDIYKKGFSTKQVKSGIGLWEVKKLVNKQKNSQIFATTEKGKFTQHLIIEKID